ncbi:hypothetical protein AA309_23325 [Microvirga vignae]|uniref:Uncharacterized protein n=1 Tax=Microvirga vignae TaxID=1225564 RepID=A0A0H1R6K0_9HYPH|nr:hypothetical protein [Microvirga vignae]KLK90855.1 hypothetical protein AA309_23325 [Microvirga vignae]
MVIEDDPLFQRAEKAVTEAVQLRQRLLAAQEQVQHQIQEMARIEAELDLLLPHPPDELARVRELLAQDPPVEGERSPGRAWRWRPG